MSARPRNFHRVRARILLVRHGRSAHRHDGNWLDADGVRRFMDAYDSAGILPDDAPPAAIQAAAASADVLAASDLPRALASVRRLAPGREPAITELLREIPLETPAFLRGRMPVLAWDFLLYLRWSYRLMRGTETPEVIRARAATDWLIDRAGKASTVVAVTHGSFRRIVAACFVQRGWRAEPGWRRYTNWSSWSFVSPE